MAEDMYKELLHSLHEALNDDNDKPIEASDENLNSAAAAQAKEQDEQYENRNKLYTQLLGIYIDNYKHKEKTKGIYKLIFYIVTLLLFVGIIGCGLYGIIILSVKGDGNLANVGIAIVNIAGIISSLIIIPKIIAEHLFPTNEESNMLEMVKNMQNNDTSIRNILHDNKKEE